MKTFVTILIVVLLILGLGYFFTRKSGNSGTTNTGTTYSTPYATPASTGGNTTGTSTATTTSAAMIRVTSPTPNQVVKSPLTVTGEARGNWYFEASFPIKVIDANGKVLGQIPAQAQGDWMTANFVPFRAVLTFSTSTTATGTLLLEKDNPSGLPQNVGEFRVPIRFR